MTTTTALTGHQIGTIYQTAGRRWGTIRNGAAANMGDLCIQPQSDSSDFLRLYRVVGTESVQEVATVHGGGHSQKVWLEQVVTIRTQSNPSWTGTDSIK